MNKNPSDLNSDAIVHTISNTIMLTTGILSLNIHDSLTFEGTELCLNPDLFTTSEHGGGSSQKTNAAAIGVSSIGSGNSAGTSNFSSSGLSIGDIIEIRVWDPLPKEAGVKSPASSSSVRKRFHQVPIIPTATMNMHGAASVGRDGSSAMNGGGGPVEPGGTVPSLRPRTTFYPNNPLQHSAPPDQLDPNTNEEGVNTKTMMNEGKSSPFLLAPVLTSNPLNTATTNNALNQTELFSQQRLPPVFPRNRSGTADAGNLYPLLASKPPKPQTTTHRRASSTAGAIPIPQRSPKQQHRHQPNSLLTNNGHRRDISDMTADTTYQLENIINDVINVNLTDSPDTIIDEGITAESNYNDALSKITAGHRLRLSFVLKVMEKTLTSFKGNSRTQVSVLRRVADLYNLSNYDLVTVHKIEPQDEEEVLKAVSADFVVVTIKDQFISRGDMLLFQTKLIGSWIYEGQRLTELTRGIKAHAREIRHGNFSAKSGIVTDNTNITFRSRSARIVWLVQLSSEMWEYSSPYERQYEPESICEIYFDQWIRFLYKLFKKWKELEVRSSKTMQTCKKIFDYIFC